MYLRCNYSCRSIKFTNDYYICLVMVIPSVVFGHESLLDVYYHESRDHSKYG
jgi:hypothetical protein